mgnify:CR=1 FL=1
MTDQSITRRNIGVLTAAQALGGASAPIVMSLGGLVGQQLAKNSAWITLPVSLFGLGLAIGTLPAAFIMRHHGRRNGYVVGVGFGVASGLIAALGIMLASFWIFCAGTFLAGFYGAYVQSYRFAAADTAEDALKAKAISWVMVGGLAGAIIGPQLVIFTRDAVAGTPYVGSFLSQALLPLIALPILLMLRTPSQTQAEAVADSGRTVLQLLAMPRYLLAVAAGVVSYGVMAFVMTAAPVAMVNHGHSVDNAALGIQWHLLAMFGPSFFTGRLIARFGSDFPNLSERLEALPRMGQLRISSQAGVAPALILTAELVSGLTRLTVESGQEDRADRGDAVRAGCDAAFDQPGVIARDVEQGRLAAPAAVIRAYPTPGPDAHAYGGSANH